MVVDKKVSTIILLHLPLSTCFFSIFVCFWLKDMLYLKEIIKANEYDRKTRLRDGSDRLYALF